MAQASNLTTWHKHPTLPLGTSIHPNHLAQVKLSCAKLRAAFTKMSLDPIELRGVTMIVLMILVIIVLIFVAMIVTMIVLMIVAMIVTMIVLMIVAMIVAMMVAMIVEMIVAMIVHQSVPLLSLNNSGPHYSIILIISLKHVILLIETIYRFSP